jgi:hypothetical protein
MYYEEENRSERIILLVAIGMGVAAILIFCLAVFIIVDPLGMRTPPPPTATPTLTPTRPPTWTTAPTRTPAPTSTPVPTSTPTLVPTNTPTETPTVKPTRRPPPPPPPTPLPYRVSDKGGRPDCTQVLIEGWVSDVNGFTLGGVAVHIWSDRGHNATLVTDTYGYYKLLFLGSAVDYQTFWYVQVMEGSAGASSIERLPISADCVNGIQVYKVSWQRNR